mgnify:CR=1 FL=1
MLHTYTALDVQLRWHKHASLLLTVQGKPPAAPTAGAYAMASAAATGRACACGSGPHAPRESCEKLLRMSTHVLRAPTYTCNKTAR